MKLVVLAGAKEGAAVPIKKDRFVIGRGKDCTLRAGSDAISRNHCELTVAESGVMVRDMGSRNGTYVNDVKIAGPTPLTHGDTLRIGPLEFRYEAEGQLKSTKAPKVDSIAEAVARTASKSQQRGLEEDISDWLLGAPGKSSPPSIGETLAIRTDETRLTAESALKALAEAETRELSPEEQAAIAASQGGAVEEEDAKGKKKKKEPGKLPFQPPKAQSKDSRDAAAQVLRDMSRRR